MEENKTANDDGMTPRPMFKGNWKCADCGAEITELPFEPDGDRPLHCRDCWAKKRNSNPNRGGFRERKMFQGNWECADCGAKITELPFEPKGGSPIRCRECWMKQKKLVTTNFSK